MSGWLFNILIFIIKMAVIVYEGDSYIEYIDNDDYQHALLRADNSVPNTVSILNNYFECIDTKGYLLDAGDEAVASTNNNLDGMIITGNKFKWNGTPGSPSTHGMFMGFNINMIVKYNYLDGVPYNILFKSGTSSGVNMNSTSGGAAYNIIKNPKMGIGCKGFGGVNIYNNTIYNSYNSGSIIYLDGNHDYTPDTYTSPQGVKVKNNILYSVYDLPFLYIESGCETDFECDYNVYYCENSSGHYPRFSISGTSYTWDQWRARGYDTHSVVIDPDFIDLTNFVPSIRLDYGTNLGSTWSSGLSTTATWVVDNTPTTAIQNGTWQVGARVYNAIPVTDFSADDTSIIEGSTVTFTDESINTPTSWSWTFGDGGISSLQNPTHVYSSAGTYTVSLIASNAYGSDTETKSSYITVSSIGNNSYYLSPSGDDITGTGSISNPWYTITKAMTVAIAGDTVYMRDGSYNYSTRQLIGNKHGSSGNYITIINYPNETPIINAIIGYSEQEGIYIYDSSYIYLKGLEITGFTQPSSSEWGNAIKAIDISHCVFELLNIHHNCFGISLSDDDDISDDNLFLNCDISYSEDPITAFPPPYDHLFPYGNADGITIRLGNGQGTTNTVRGCRMWYCSDDGMDLWENEGMIIVDGCWSFWNGYYPDTFTRSPGDGNGFKLGPTYLTPYNIVLRQVRNCLAFQNPVWGFVRNGAMCNMEIYNNTAYDNGYSGSGGGFFFGNDGSSSDTAFYIKNNIAYNNVNNYSFWNNELLGNVDHNSWQVATITDVDFKSISNIGVTGPRQLDGSLPELNFLKIADGSDLIHIGINVGLTTDGNNVTWNSPPSIGAYEYVDEEDLGDAPIANFTADTTPIYTGDSIEFTDTSINTPTSWLWNFGDGGTSTQQNPTHTFLTAGTFTITLTSTNDYGSDTETKINYITVVIPGLAPVSGFIVNDTTAYIGQTIYFTDQSLNAPTSWLWNFGDGDSSINQNPTHSYSTVGIFTVTLIVTNTYGTDTETKVDYIIVTDPNPPDGCLVQIPFMRFFII